MRDIDPRHDSPPRAGAGADPWTEHMRRGEYEAAWSVCDAVQQRRAGAPCWHLPRHLQHVWSGAPLHGKRVLVRCYHGLGDTIQFVRYAPLLKQLAAETIVWAQPALVPLLRTVDGIDHLVPLHDGIPDVEYDVDVESMELPHVFRSSLATVPATVPYLHVTPSRLTVGPAVLTVAIARQAGEWDTRRSIPLSALAPLTRIRGIRLLLVHPEQGPLRDATFERVAGTDTVVGTARLMRAVDLVISADSMPAHLAGALGVPVWTLLRRSADWRWMEGRDDSPWYPTMRLFRQEQEGDWAAPIARVVTALEELVGAGNQSQ